MFLPVTAIPTFIDLGAAPSLALTYLDGRRENREVADVPDLARHVADLVAEGANPHHTLGIARVDIAAPHQTLSGITLIDTPGVGSTHRHNTATAQAVLPECDAALFVVSADLPITEVEIEYLDQISRTVARLVFVMNKVDLVSEEDRDASVAFLRGALRDGPEVAREPQVFPVSARAALKARLTDDPALLEKSGFVELEQHLTDVLAREKRSILEAAVAIKARTIVADLKAETDIRFKALSFPLIELEERIATFETTSARFEEERLKTRDLLSGDRARALGALEEACENVAKAAHAGLRPQAAKLVADIAAPEEARSLVEPLVDGFFDRELSAAVDRMAARIDANAAAHRERLDHLVTLVRQTAAHLMDVRLPDLASDDAFRPTREPYWVSSGSTESLGSVAADALSRILPRPIRTRRLQQRILEGIDAAVTRNVASLHWAMRQNIEETFRRLEADLARSLEGALAATRDVMVLARARRVECGAAAARELSKARQSAEELGRIEQSLRVSRRSDSSP